jgi:hypothetical protein
MGESDLPGEVGSYIGTRMFWSHFDAATSRDMLTESGLGLIWDRAVVDFQNPTAAHRFLLVVKP